ncbi:MAG: alpha/beta hydrolase [Rhodospirillales bacterium]|nr:MAG: alpha/beta hydrolase [Rhodospirillales bacterium]
MFLEIAGTRLEAAWIGSGPADSQHGRPILVFLHDGLGCVDLWRGFPERLCRKAGLGGFLYSRAGYGRSDPIPLPRPLDYETVEGVTVLPHVLEAAGIGDAILVGHSDGATMALLCCGGTPAAGIRGIIAMAPHVFNEDRSVAGIIAARQAYREGDLRARLARVHGANVDCAFLGWSGAWLDPGFRHWNIEPVLADVRVPVLVIQGEDDEYGTLAQVDAIRAGAGGPVQTVVLPGLRPCSLPGPAGGHHRGLCRLCRQPCRRARCTASGLSVG